MSDIFFVSKVFSQAFLSGFSMEFHQCDWSIVYVDCLSVLISLASPINHRKTFCFRFPILALLTKMYNQKLQIRATVY